MRPALRLPYHRGTTTHVASAYPFSVQAPAEPHGPYIGVDLDETDAGLAEVLPAELAVSLGSVAEACRDGLMAVAVEAGLATALAIMNEEAAAICGAWNAPDPQRQAERGGTAPTSVVMGGQRLPVRRPRVHAVEGGERAGEIPLETYGIFAQGDLLSRVAMDRMLAGVATRGFERAGVAPHQRRRRVQQRLHRPDPHQRPGLPRPRSL